MIKYMRLQLFLMSKKVSTYIIPVIFAISLFLVIGIPIMLTPTTKPMIDTMLKNSWVLILPFIISAIFVAVKALNIFKDSEEDGTELLIVSKPITRFKLVMGKFVSLYIMLFFFAIFTFIIAALIGLADKNASSRQIIEFAASAAFGTFIVQLLLSSAITFFASIFGKVGTIITSILIPLTLTLTSIILIPISNSRISTNYTKSYIAQSKNGKFVEKEIYGYYKKDKEDEKQMINHEHSWYKQAAYFDVWTQLSSFYTIFQPEKQIPGTLSKWSIVEGETKDLKKVIDPKLIYKKSKDQNYYLNVISGDIFSTWTTKQGIESLNNAKDIYDKHADEIATKINALKNSLSTTEWNAEVKNIINDLGIKTSRNEMNIITGYTLINLLNDKKINESKLDLTSNTLNDFSNNINKVDKTMEDIQVIKGKAYIPRGLLYAMWLIITFGVGGLVVLRYMRRDFK